VTDLLNRRRMNSTRFSTLRTFHQVGTQTRVRRA
jgi:hypothetical protein